MWFYLEPSIRFFPPKKTNLVALAAPENEMTVVSKKMKWLLRLCERFTMVSLYAGLGRLCGLYVNIPIDKTGLPDFYTKNPNLGTFWGALGWIILSIWFFYSHCIGLPTYVRNDHLVYIIFGHLVYIFPVLVCCRKNNLAYLRYWKLEHHTLDRANTYLQCYRSQSYHRELQRQRWKYFTTQK
jgi:hypothetical protein